jgi:hypothetical protein
LSLAVDDDGGAQAGHPEEIHDGLGAIGSPDHISTLFALPEVLPLRQGAPRCGVDGNNLDATVLELALNPAQGWSLQPAGGSTREGKVEDNHLSGVLAQREESAHAGADGEIRH